MNPGSGDILKLIRDGRVLARPGIDHVDGHTVQFTDGTSEEADAIVCATGELALIMISQDLTCIEGISDWASRGRSLLVLLWWIMEEIYSLDAML